MHHISSRQGAFLIQKSDLGQQGNTPDDGQVFPPRSSFTFIFTVVFYHVSNGGVVQLNEKQ